MKKKLIFAMLVITTAAFSQVGVGTTTPNANAELEISSTTKGLLLPRVALTATNAFAPLSAHVAGMHVYNTATAGIAPNNVTPGEYYNDGAKWVRLISSADTAFDATNDAFVNNNTNTRVELGTNSDGTTARTAGTEFVIKNDGKVGIGTVAPDELLTVKNGSFRMENDDNWNAYKGVTYSTSKYPQLFLTKARGTKASPLYPATGNTMGVFKVANAIDEKGGAGFRVSSTESQDATKHGSSLTVFTTPTGTDNNIDQFIVDHNGNVGIGTTSPTSKLHVLDGTGTGTYFLLGEMYASANTTTGNTSALRFGVASSARNSGDMRFRYVGSGSTSNSIDFSFNGIAAPIMSVQASGNVGIGTTAPAQALDVNGKIRINTMDDLSSGSTAAPVLWDNTTKTLVKSNTTVTMTNTNSITPEDTYGAAYKLYVHKTNGCGSGFINEYLISGSNTNNIWNMTYVRGTSYSGATTFTQNSTTSITATNTISGCADSTNTASMSYTVTIGAGTGTITFSDGKTYNVRLEKLF